MFTKHLLCVRLRALRAECAQTAQLDSGDAVPDSVQQGTQGAAASPGPGVGASGAAPEERGQRGTGWRPGQAGAVPHQATGEGPLLTSPHPSL